MNLGLYAKAINAALLLAAGVLIVALEDNSIGLVEWMMVAVALLRGILAFGVRPEWGKVGVYLPLIVTAIIGAVTQIITVVQDGGGGLDALGTREVVLAVVAFLVALGSTYSTPNAVASDALLSAPPSAKA